MSARVASSAIPIAQDGRSLPHADLAVLAAELDRGDAGVGQIAEYLVCAADVPLAQGLVLPTEATTLGELFANQRVVTLLGAPALIVDDRVPPGFAIARDRRGNVRAIARLVAPT